MNPSNTTNNTAPNIIYADEFIPKLEAEGKILFGPHFTIPKEDLRIIFKLMVYFWRDQDTANKIGIDLRKGILMSGPIGCGKTSIMQMFGKIVSEPMRFPVIATREVTFDFLRNGFDTIYKYSHKSFKTVNFNRAPISYCFDDLGLESIANYYGNDSNVMAEVLLSRYQYFVSHGMKTHLTTNLSSSEIEERYGTRVRSRMREMFNIIAYAPDAKDKRK